MQPSTFLTNLTGLVIASVWIGALLIGAFEQDWTPLTITTPVMFLLAGFAFGVQVIRRQKNGASEERKGERWSHPQ